MKRMTLLVLLGLLTVGCTSSGPKEGRNRHIEAKAVLNRTWQWEATITPLETIPVPHPDRYTFHLAPQGKAQIRLDCKRGRGSYSIADGKLAFGPLMSTRRACPPGSWTAFSYGIFSGWFPFSSRTLRFIWSCPMMAAP